MGIEELDYLLDSEETWNRYIASRQEKSCICDFSMSVIRDKNLNNRSLVNCDFTGSQFELVNFDGSTFEKCRFESMVILYSSFVNCTFVDCIFLDVSIKRTILRESSLEKCVIRNFKATDLEVRSCNLFDCSADNGTAITLQIESSQFKSSVFLKIFLRDLHMDNCTLLDVNLERYAKKRFIIVGCMFTNSSFNRSVGRSGTIKDTTFKKCELRDLNNKKFEITDCGIVRCRINKFDMTNWNLSNTIFVESHFHNCLWPDMNYGISFYGGFIAPPHLPTTPVQDMSGIDPILRRTIRDSQYLSSIYYSCDSPISKALFCFWGMTSGYGQSVIRLLMTLFAGTILIGSLSIFFFEEHFVFTTKYLIEYYFSIFQKVIGSELVYNVKLNPWASFFSQFFGFVWFGLLIGVVTNKLTELGAD